MRSLKGLAGLIRFLRVDWNNAGKNPTGGGNDALLLYVALQGDDKISVLTIDSQTGKLTPQAEVSVPGGPFTMAISPDRKFLYAGSRDTPQLSSFQINQANGGLTQHGTVSLDAWPVYINTDRKGKFVLSAYYQGAHAAVHPIGSDGSVGGPPIEWLATATGAHAMQTDLTNSYAFVPHIAGNGPNAIFQFRFDENTGRLTPNSPARVEPEEFLGPRHFCFHPSLDILYFSNEQDCSVSGYRLDTATGTLSLFQTITTLPEGYTERNTCSQIQVSASGRFPVRSQSGPRQHRLLFDRCLNGTVDRHWHSCLRAKTQCPMPRAPGQVSLLRRPGLGPHGLFQCEPRFRGVDPAGDLSTGKWSGLGLDH